MLLSSIQRSQRGLSPGSTSLESLFEIQKSRPGHSTHSKYSITARPSLQHSNKFWFSEFWRLFSIRGITLILSFSEQRSFDVWRWFVTVRPTTWRHILKDGSLKPASCFHAYVKNVSFNIYIYRTYKAVSTGKAKPFCSCLLSSRDKSFLLLRNRMADGRIVN